MNDVEATFVAAIMRTAELLVITPKKRRRPGEVGVETPKRKLSYRLRLMRCTQRGSTRKRTPGMRSCGGPPGKHVTGGRECEVQQSFVFSSATSLSWRSSYAWETTTDSPKTFNRCSWRRRKRSNHSASVTSGGDCCATKGVSSEMDMILPLAAERQIRHAPSRHLEEAAAASSRECPRDRAHRGGDCHSDEGNDKRESNGAGRPSRGTAETRTLTRPDYPAEALPTHHLHLARGESPTAAAVERRGYYSTPEEGWQDEVRKLLRHLARVARG